MSKMSCAKSGLSPVHSDSTQLNSTGREVELRCIAINTYTLHDATLYKALTSNVVRFVLSIFLSFCQLCA